MRVTPELHAAVLRRDGRCFLTRLDPEHSCRDVWGTPHASSDLDRLTVDHVHRHAGGTKGKRAPSDLGHLVALCGAANVSVPSRVVREAQRAYLATLEA